MNLKKAVLAGLIAGMVAFLVGSLLYMNPFVSRLYEQYKNLGGMRPVEYFGGLGNFLILMALGGIVFTIIPAIFYAIVYKSIPGKTIFRGVFFGLFIWLLETVPSGYNTWLLRDYPLVLISVEIINGLVGSLVAGILIAIVYGEW